MVKRQPEASYLRREAADSLSQSGMKTPSASVGEASRTLDTSVGHMGLLVCLWV